MKILFVQEYFYPVITGGSEIYSYILIKNLIKRGHDIFVVGGGFSNKLENVENIPIQRVNLMPSRFLFNIKSLFFIKKSIKRFKPDLIHGNTYHASIPSGLIANIKNIPIVISVHNLFLHKWKIYFNYFKSSLYYAFERIEFSIPYDKIIACDLYSLKNLQSLGLNQKSVYIPYPIETDKFYPRNKKNNKIVIGTAGRLYSETKKFDTFIDLLQKFKNNKNVEFLIIGQLNPSQNDFLRKFKNLKIIGKIPHSQMPEYLNKIDIFIGQGIVAKEAMACGCVSILNQVEERLIIYHKPEIDAGVLLFGNQLKLIENLINDPKERKIQSMKSFQFIKENYSTQKIVDDTVKIYEEIIG